MEKSHDIKIHLVNGIKRTIPFILLYSVLLALSTEFALPDIFHEYTLIMIVPILCFNTLYSIDKFNYVFPAIVMGYIASINGTSLLGGIIVSIVIGLVVIKIITSNLYIKSIRQIIIFNLLILLVMYFVTTLVIVPPIDYLLETVRTWIYSIDANSKLLLIGVLSGLIVVDLGGPFNKLSFAFLIELIINGNYDIVGPVLISVTIPPLAILTSLYIYKDRFDKEDLNQKKFATLASVFGITEGALSITFRRIRILPLLLFVSITSSIIAGVMNLESNILIAAIPGLIATSNILVYILCHLLGVLLFILVFPFVIKKQNIIPKITD